MYSACVRRIASGERKIRLLVWSDRLPSISSGWMAGAASRIFFHLPFISLSWMLVFYPIFRSAEAYGGRNKPQVLKLN
jgi:hypothetical protein